MKRIHKISQMLLSHKLSNSLIDVNNVSFCYILHFVKLFSSKLWHTFIVSEMN